WVLHEQVRGDEPRADDGSCEGSWRAADGRADDGTGADARAIFHAVSGGVRSGTDSSFAADAGVFGIGSFNLREDVVGGSVGQDDHVRTEAKRGSRAEVVSRADLDDMTAKRGAGGDDDAAAVHYVHHDSAVEGRVDRSVFRRERFSDLDTDLGSGGKLVGWAGVRRALAGVIPDVEHGSVVIGWNDAGIVLAGSQGYGYDAVISVVPT